MILKDWIKSKFKTTRKTLLASIVARQYLNDTNQPVDQTTINKTIIALDDLGLLLGPANRPGTLSRLVAK